MRPAARSGIAQNADWLFGTDDQVLTVAWTYLDLGCVTVFAAVELSRNSPPLPDLDGSGHFGAVLE